MKKMRNKDCGDTAYGSIWGSVVSPLNSYSSCLQRFVPDFCRFLSHNQTLCFRWVKALFLMGERDVSKVWKRGFWWVEGWTGLRAGLYWIGWHRRLQDYRITPCFLCPGFLGMNIYTIYFIIYIFICIYILIFIYIIINIHKSICEKLLILLYF